MRWHSIVTHLLLICAQPIPRGATRGTMERCASSHIPRGSIELSNEPLQHALAAGAPRKCHDAPPAPLPPTSQPLIFNLLGMRNRRRSGAWHSGVVCQPGLQIWRDRCQPAVEGAVLNTVRRVGLRTILALWSVPLKLPVSCCSRQACF